MCHYLQPPTTAAVMTSTNSAGERGGAGGDVLPIIVLHISPSPHTPIPQKAHTQNTHAIRKRNTTHNTHIHKNTMDTILSAVKDTLIDKALGRDDKDEDKDQDREHHDSSYPQGYGGHGGRAQDQRPAGYGQDSARDTRGYSREEACGRDVWDEDHERGYGGHGGRSQDQRPAGYGQDSERDVRGYPRPDERGGERGAYGGHGEEDVYGGRAQGQYRHDTERDVRGYPRPDVRGGERVGGYGGHGGRPQEQGRSTYGHDTERDVRGYPRDEVPVGREYRPAAGSNTASEYYSGASVEYHGAVEVAERESSESGSLFSSALKMLNGNHTRKDDVDEDEIVNSHKQVYGGDGGSTGQLGSQSLGQAAAMQALKHFTGGGGGSAAGGGQNAFIGMAMAEAVKLFDTQKAQGNVVSDGFNPPILRYDD